MYNNKNYMTVIRYLSSINPEKFMSLAWIYVELFLNIYIFIAIALDETSILVHFISRCQTFTSRVI